MAPTGRIQIIQRSFSLFFLTLKTNPTTFTAELLPQAPQSSDLHLWESSGGLSVSYHPVSSVSLVNRVQAAACLWKELSDPPHVSLRWKGHLKRCLYYPGGFAESHLFPLPSFLQLLFKYQFSFIFCQYQESQALLGKLSPSFPYMPVSAFCRLHQMRHLCRTDGATFSELCL